MTTPAKSTLDRRREKSAAAHAAAEKARAGVTKLDQRLETNANLTREQTQTLRNIEAEAKRLRRALKNAGKERARLTKERRKAQNRAEKAESRAQAAEAKYDQSVLAEMVKREKERDAAATAARSTAAKASRGDGGRHTTAAEPPPERPDAGTTTAVRTAARKTAAAARSDSTR